MKTIFVIGQIMSGKNILWKLLDGHSKIVVSAVHTNFALHFLKKNVQEYYLNRKNLPFKKDKEKLNFITLKISNKIKIDLTIGEYFESLYKFTNYRTFLTLARNNCIITNNKELENDYNDWEFDIIKFEEEIFKRLFSTKKEIAFSEFFLETQKIYCNVVQRNVEEIEYFVEPIENETYFFRLIDENLNNYKIISTFRDDIDLIYANFKRTNSFEKKYNFYNFLFLKRNINIIKFLNQYNFYKKRIYNFHQFLKSYEKKEDVHFVKFEDLILNTKKTMQNICKYLNIDFENILLKLSANGIELIETKPTLTQINDSAKEFFNETEIKRVKNFYSKFKPNIIYFKILVFYLIVKIYFSQLFKVKL